MSSKFLFFFICVFSFYSYSQDSNCLVAKTGVFKIDSGEFGITEIHRTETKQIETNEKNGFQATYDVVWEGQCVYYLKNKKVLKGKTMYEFKPEDYLKVEILKVEGNNVFLKLSSSFSDFVTEVVMQKMK